MKTKLILLLSLSLLGAAPLAKVQAGDAAAGKAIFEQRCVDLCHQAPAARQLRPAQWRIVLHTMQQRMAAAGMTPLSEQELAQLWQYLIEEG